jgi:hypothetical protein
MVISGFVDVDELGSPTAGGISRLPPGVWTGTGARVEELFLRTYGVGRDSDRVAFYRLLYDVVS